MSTLATVGFVTPPAWFDPAPQEFPNLCEQKVRVQQTFLNLPLLDFDSLTAIADAENDIAQAAFLLRQAEADVVAFTGTPFTWAGLQGEAEIRARNARIRQVCECPFIMPGTAMVDALRDLNAGRIAVYGSYYTRPWIEMTAKRFEDFGFEVALAASSSDLGLVPELASIDQHETASAPKVVSEGLRRIAAEYPHLEAIAIPGSGVRTAAYIEQRGRAGPTNRASGLVCLLGHCKGTRPDISARYLRSLLNQSRYLTPCQNRLPTGLFHLGGKNVEGT